MMIVCTSFEVQIRHVSCHGDGEHTREHTTRERRIIQPNAGDEEHATAQTPSAGLFKFNHFMIVSQANFAQSFMNKYHMRANARKTKIIEFAGATDKRASMLNRPTLLARTSTGTQSPHSLCTRRRRHRQQCGRYARRVLLLPHNSEQCILDAPLRRCRRRRRC